MAETPNVPVPPSAAEAVTSALSAAGSSPATRQAMSDLLSWKDEPLNPDLVPYLEEATDQMPWPMLRHPLVYCVPYFGGGFANRQYEYKTQAIEQAEAAEDWGRIVWLYERPHRLQALLDYVIGYDDFGVPLPLKDVPEEDRRLAMAVWMDSENISQYLGQWRDLFRGLPDDQTLLVEGPDDLVSYEGLPDLVRVYRGGGDDSFLSWSLDRAVAEKFAQRSGREVRERLLRKSDIFACLTGRGEAEVLAWEGEGE